MTRKKLPKIAGAAEKLGRATIMDRALASKHGVVYVHLSAFAIDVDRIREEVEGYGDPRPFAWEVFLTEAYVLDQLAGEASEVVLEDSVLAILDGRPDALGAQLAFAVWDAIVRGVLPQRLESAFASWQARPDELVRALAPLWQEPARARRELATGALEVELTPPIAPPTRAALEKLRA